MRVLLDTQLAFWWLAEPARVPESVRALLMSAGTEAWVSHVTLWELALQQQNGRANLELSRFITQAERDGFQWLPVTAEHLQALIDLTELPAVMDDFDRLLLAQSMAEPLVLLTTNQIMANCGAPVRLM